MTPNEVNNLIDEKLRKVLGNFMASDNKLTLHKSIELIHPNTLLGGSRFYPGVVTQFATAGNVFPEGWSVASAGTGRFTVTHNLGHGDYAVVATVQGNNDRIIYVYNVGLNDFGIDIRAPYTGTLYNENFHFLLMV